MGGVTLLLRIQGVAVSRLPEAWRSHRELREGFLLTAELRVADLLRSDRASLRWVGALTAFAAVLGALDVPLWGSLLVATVYATYSAGYEVAQIRDAQRSTTAVLALPELPDDRPLAAQYAGSLPLSKFGFFLVPVFLGYLLLDLTALI